MSFLPRTVACISLVAGLGCSAGGGHTLQVNLRSDLRSGIEVVVARAELFDEAPGQTTAGTSRDRLLDETMTLGDGIRLTDYGLPDPGRRFLRVQLLGASGEVVLERRAVVQVRGVTVATMVMTRDCVGVECPTSDPALLACVGGRCVDPRCTPETPEFCPPPVCDDDTACEVMGCADGRCVDDVCMWAERPGACEPTQWCSPEAGCVDRSGRDAGAPLDDAGIAPDDAGSAEADAGGPADAGEIADAGPPDADAGPPDDAGSAEADAGIPCEEGFGDCDGVASNGCEQPLSTLVHCGACETACDLPDATESCASGSCEVVECAAGRADCDAIAATGCEADLAAPTSCGSCDRVCEAGDTCATAVCCPPGWDCDPACVSGCGCGGAALCALTCDGACDVRCDNNDTQCRVTATPGADATFDCRSGSRCDLDARGARAVTLNCQNNRTDCDLDCRGTDSCAVDCSSGALCAVQCDVGDLACGFDTCSAPLDCGGGLFRCGEPC
jgi:hypothetical protein